MENHDWKRSVGFPINYNSDQSSGDDFDTSDVVIRHPNRQRSSGYLLADGGDGSVADLLGTTPPRARIRNKEKRRSHLDGEIALNRFIKGTRKSAHELTHSGYDRESPEPPGVDERLKKRASMKIIRTRERDLKMDINKSTRDGRSDSMPSPNPAPAVPTLVESCNRFMSLTSKLKLKSRDEEKTSHVDQKGEQDGLLQSRVNFHDTFSMLIKMGNVEKGCRRTISFEEQVWQNELKDLIWLELQAKIAGRTLAQQDVFLCAQRDIVPTIVQNIIDYRFMNPQPCESRSASLICYKSELGDGNVEEDDQTNTDDEDHSEQSYGTYGCLSFNCVPCTAGIGRALKEVGTLLDSFYNAETLYPSSKAMATHHPLIATTLFNNRLKAMCLWYNVALHMRMRILAVRRLILTIQHKHCTQQARHLPAAQADATRSIARPSAVRFDVETTSSSDSNNSQHTEADGNESQDADSRRNGTVDTSASSESGYLSESGCGSECTHLRDDYDVYNMGPLKEVIMLRLLKKCEVSPYRDYHYEVLKTQSVRRSMMFINKMRMKILKKVYLTLERFQDADNQYEESSFEPNDDSKDDEESTRYENAKEIYELRRYGCWSEECVQMRLPSYRSHYLLLNTICMETVHDYLSLRRDTQPANPSCLTVKQLIHELKEGIDIATEMRNAFVRNIDAALVGYEQCGARNDLQRVVRTFDATLGTVVQQYMSYLRTMSAVEHMPRSCLEAEWEFSARLARTMRAAACTAPHTFTDIVCNQLKRLLNQFQDHFTSLMNQEDNYPEGSDDVEAKRHFVYSLCREAQNIYASEREVTLQTVQFARILATRLKRSSQFVACRERIFKCLMAIRDCIARHAFSIIERTKLISWEEDLAETLHARLRELLLQLYKLGFELHKELHKFVHNKRAVNEPRRPASLQPMRRNTATATQPHRKRPQTIYINHAKPLSYSTSFHKELHRFINDTNADRQRPHQSTQKRPTGNSPPKTSRPKLNRSESISAEEHDFGVFDDYTTSIESNVPEIQYEEEATECISHTPPVSEVTPNVGDEVAWAVQVSRAIIEFAKCWMNFVMERCGRGRGLRPRWASQGLEFLMLACDPYNTKHLSDKEFEELKVVMDACISHVIGSRAPPTRNSEQTPPPRRHTRHRVHSPAISSGNVKNVPLPPTPPTEPDPLLNFNIHTDTVYKRRLTEAISRLECDRDEKLRALKTVGRVVDRAGDAAHYEYKPRQLTFKWQRGLKIGAGTFGKVYTVVNTETGQLLAMKELSIAAGDRRALQKAANELRVLEGIQHPHLVRYYGCEIHREEMLLFMEVCVEGSLEAMLVNTGPLPEMQIRRYTKQLVSAVHELHYRKIAHRDIKSGNIFLTNEGHCLKLGDFGCAVKIRANTTVAGELQGHVGTQAYMAPEVFMKPTGHGRAADIWSLGCVVTEMASGKRPFSEYDINYQIMFVVGMGRRPTIPTTLSAEGQKFCVSCLTHDPELRPKATLLIHDHFLMVKADEECNCDPAASL